MQAAPIQDLSDQGMPSLAERAAEVEVRHDGMPQNISIPKPAPIPEGVDVNVKQPSPVTFDEPVSRVAEEKEQQKNASVGLITIIILVILAVLAWLFFK